MATNPNVPADQRAAAESSAPAAKVTTQQPAQLPTGNQPAPAAVAPMTAVPAAPVVPAAPAAPAKAVDMKTSTNRAEEISTEQKNLKEVMAEAEGKDYFEQQEVFAKAFEEREGEDSFRRAVRIERERETLLAAGDPTRDPVAKQKAMDMNTVAPGAVADAQKIKNIGIEDSKK